VGLFTQLISLSPKEKTQSVSSTSPRAGEGVERLAVFSIAVTLQESTATARIGSQADVNAADRVRVLSDAYDLPSLSASATANVFLYPTETSSAKTTIAVGVQYGAFSNTSLAEIAGGAQVDAAGDIVVNSRTTIPKNFPYGGETSPAQLQGKIVSALMSMDGGISGFFNSQASSCANDAAVGLGASVSIIDINSSAESRIHSTALLNQRISSHGRVSVTSDVATYYVGSAGVLGWLFTPTRFLLGLDSKDGFSENRKRLFDPLGSGGESGVGAAIGVTTISAKSTAVIETGAKVSATAVDVLADTYTSNILLGVSGSSSEKVGVNGALSYVTIDNVTLAQVQDGAVIAAGNGLKVDAHDEVFNLNIGGGIALGTSVGVGVTVGVNEISRNTRSLIGGDVLTIGGIGSSPSTGVDAAANTIDLGYLHGFTTGDQVRYSDPADRGDRRIVRGKVKRLGKPERDRAAEPAHLFLGLLGQLLDFFDAGQGQLCKGHAAQFTILGR